MTMYPDVGVRAAEVDHRAHAEHVERHGGQQKPLEAARDAHERAHEEQPQARDDVEGTAHVARLRDRQVVDDLQERTEVAGPAVIRDLVHSIEG
jgi:hypothetical protein